MLDELAAEFFTLAVFLCDDLLQIKPALVTSNSDLTRFFDFARRLPLELQMILCCRAVGSMKQNILHEDSEIAFKSLALTLVQPTLAEIPWDPTPTLLPTKSSRSLSNQRSRSSCSIS